MNKETILCAAIHYLSYPVWSGSTVINNGQWPGVVLCGYRHDTIITQYHKLTGKSTGPSNSTQGFLTSLNRFVTRKEAAIIAYQADQITTSKSELFSEDLY